MNDYDIPFDGMSEEEYMYRIMNPEDPLYMGDTTYDEEDYVEESDDDYDNRVADWYSTQFGKIIDAVNDYMSDPDDDPRHYFDDINYDPFPDR